MSKDKNIEGRGLFRALESIIWYDGHDAWLKDVRDDMERHLKNGGSYNYICPFDHNQWHTEQHTIYMLLVGMFGDWGTSIRGGWIEDIEGCIKFIEEICKEAGNKMEEMERAIDEFCQKELGTEFNDDILTNFAKHLYSAGYHKQRYGEWKLGESGYIYFCSCCGHIEDVSRAIERKIEEMRSCAMNTREKLYAFRQLAAWAKELELGTKLVLEMIKEDFENENS